MSRTILDLFRSKQLSSGKTAEETYRVRNSKDLPIQTNNLILNNTSIPAVNLLRRTASRVDITRTTETIFEQELIGLRPLSQLSSPFIYGTAILRISQQRSDQTEQMKQATGGEGGGSGVIGGALEKAGDGIKGGLKKLGVNFPSQLNPTSYSDKLKVDDKSEIPGILAQIKEDGAGNVIGKLLSQPQTPNQLVRNAAGLAVGGIKNKVRGVLFGDRATTAFSNEINGKSSLSGNFLLAFNYGSNNDFKERGNIDFQTGTNRGGSKYSSGFIRKVTDANENPKLDASLNNFKIRKVNQGIKSLKDSGDEFTNRYTNLIDESRLKLDNETTSKATFNTEGETIDDSVGLINKIPRIILPHKEDRPDGKKLYSQFKAKNSLTRDRGILLTDAGYFGDVLNNRGIERTERTVDGERNLDDIDFIPLKFTLLSNNRTIYFRSHIDGISETFSPSWDSSKFVGNPFSFYTYSGIERSVSFNLKVVATTKSELVKNWERLSFLSSMVYPSGYQQDTFIIPPFIKFTLGNLYKGKEGFIESLSFSVDENMGWEIGLTQNDDGETVVDDIMKDYKLPMKIDVSIGIKFVESRSNTDSYTKLYSFKPVQ